jgi:stalled ribosome alternative rescue factor ArfA
MQKSAKRLVMQPKYRQRVERNRKKYTRKAKHKGKEISPFLLTAF